MIQINLAWEGAAIGVKGAKAPSHGFPWAKAFVMIVILTIGGGIYYAVKEKIWMRIPAENQPVALPEPKLELPDRPNPEVTNADAQVVEEIVKGDRAEPVRELPKPPPAPRVIPFEQRLQSQKASLEGMLRNLTALEADGVGFIEIVLEVPNHFYIEGVAGDEGQQNRFTSALRARSNKVEVLKDAEENDERHFIYYGMFQNNVSARTEGDPYVNTNEIPGILQSFASTAKGLGISFGAPKNIGAEAFDHYDRNIYQSVISADFNDIQKFMQDLQLKSIPVGINKLVMRVNSQGGISSMLQYSILEKLEN